MLSSKLLACSAIALIGTAGAGCADRACEAHPPSLEVSVTLGSDIATAEIAKVVAEVSAAGRQKSAELDPGPLKAKRRASFVVMVGEQGAQGFDYSVSLRLVDWAGAKLAVARVDASGVGNGCNAASLLLSKGGGRSDGGFSDGGVDFSAACHAGNCVGCCRADGECAAGTLDGACGSGGVACVDCSLTGGSCQSGRCESCNPQCADKICGEDNGCGALCLDGSGCTTITYSWSTGSWGNCSANCDGGTQSRTVICESSSGATVADSNCSASKPATSQSCNTQPCCSTDALQAGRRCDGDAVVQWPNFASNTGSTADQQACATQCTSFAKGSYTQWCCQLYEDSSPGTTWVCRVYDSSSYHASSGWWGSLGRCATP